jgi:hypothetical protein
MDIRTTRFRHIIFIEYIIYVVLNGISQYCIAIGISTAKVSVRMQL